MRALTSGALNAEPSFLILNLPKGILNLRLHASLVGEGTVYKQNINITTEYFGACQPLHRTYANIDSNRGCSGNSGINGHRYAGRSYRISGYFDGGFSAILCFAIQLTAWVRPRSRRRALLRPHRGPDIHHTGNHYTDARLKGGS